MEKLMAEIQKLYPVSEEDRALILQNMEEVAFSKGDFVVREGQRNSYVYFVKKGFVRAFVVRDGKDVTLWFAGDGEMAVLTPGSTPCPVSTVNIEVSEDSLFLRIPRAKMESLFEKSVGLANWGRKLVESFLQEYEHYFINYSWTDAAQQYESLIKEYPLLLQKASLKQIASYLNITPQSLSRIRASKK